MVGLGVIILNIAFTIWSSYAKSWYVYLINFALLFLASSMISTSYIQGITRGYSYLYLFGTKGLLKAIGINILAIILFVVAYFIAKFVFSTLLQIVVYFVAYLVFSTFVAVSNRQFNVAIERTKAIEDLGQRPSAKD